MKYRSSLLLSSIFALVLVATLPAATAHMPVDQLKPGMTGVGRTVFGGTTRDEFKVHILGVLRNVMGPRRNLILAKLDGGPLAQTGVIAGMSGSPVYVDGKLVGAVSYSLGAFSKEPIAGITPIDEMIDATTLPLRRPVTEKARLTYPVTHAAMAAVLRGEFLRVRPFAERPADIQAFGIPASEAGQAAMMLRPIATPMILGGFASDVFDMLASPFRDSGFLPVAGGSGAAAASAAAGGPLEPGDAVGVSLIGGDLELAATGTVTHVEGSRVYAFGHPFYNLGPTEFPMTRAHVYTLLPSLFNSTKIAGIGETIGVFQQDRATAIAGTLGKGPRLIPIRIALEPDGRPRREFSFQVVNDQLFTPLLAYVSILNTLRSYEREYGAATFTVKGKATLKSHGMLSFEDVFTGEQPSLGAAAYIAAPITFVLANDFESVELEGVDLTITSSEQRRTAKLERVWIDEVRPRPGKTVGLKILTRTYRGEESTRTVPIEIPANASGPLSILVSDGLQLAQWEQRELRQSLTPQSVAQMIRVLNNARKNNRLYVKLLTSERGAVVDGETLSSLPPSVLAVFEADRNGGNFIPLRSATIGEWELPTDHAVNGSRLLTINVEP
ncbi:MAG: hypothetical protein HYX76_09535 [Acidobacteria bacterium]|nr:hypothetical protein [Acidobacteriota bacterium]